MGLQNGIGADKVDGSYSDAVAITPSDTIDGLDGTHRLRGISGLFADVGGVVEIITQKTAQALENTGVAPTSANAVAFTLGAGVILPLRVAYVLATSTTATGIKGMIQ